LNYNRDRRDHRIETQRASSTEGSEWIDTRTGIDRRSGKDRRRDYDEQRNSVRYKLKTSASVFLKVPGLLKLLPPQKIKLDIVDLSLGGLRAQYVRSSILPYKQNTLSIETDDGEVIISEIPFKVITDYKHTRLPGDVYLRRCGFKFGSLSDSHKNLLNQLIRDYC
jgi:hypothetical protein